MKKTELSNAEIQRYSRQLILPEIGIEGQKRLKTSRVLVVGAGGLGCPVIQYLAAAGVGGLGIVDHDRVDISNIHRQVLYKEEDCGQYKAELAKRFVKKLNHFCDINLYLERLDADNIEGIFDGYDIVVDCTDNFNTRYLINDACVKWNKVLVSGAIQKFIGQISVFNFPFENGSRGPCYRCVYPQSPPAGLVQNCSEAGVVGALPGIIGSMQALEAIKVAVESNAVMAGKLLEYNTLTHRSKLYCVSRSDNCPVCQLEKTKIMLASQNNDCPIPVNNDKIIVMQPKEVFEKRHGDNGLYLVDVRPQHEHDIVNIGGEVLPLDQIRDLNPNVLDVLREKPMVLLYCKSGVRSKTAANILIAEHQLNNVAIMDGGILRWVTQVDSTLPAY